MRIKPDRRITYPNGPCVSTSSFLAQADSNPEPGVIACIQAVSEQIGSNQTLKLTLRSRKALLTVEEVAEMLSMSPKWVYKHASKGNLPAVHLPGAVRFDPIRVADWLEERGA